MEGILITNKVMDEAIKSKNGLIMFKLYFEKVYDLVEWECLEAVMGKMNFPLLWRRCITNRVRGNVILFHLCCIILFAIFCGRHI
jgi:hypothetical protein